MSDVTIIAMSPLRVGDVLHDFGGSFGRDAYHPVRVEAIGADWVIARDVETSWDNDTEGLVSVVRVCTFSAAEIAHGATPDGLAKYRRPPTGGA